MSIEVRRVSDDTTAAESAGPDGGDAPADADAGAGDEGGTAGDDGEVIRTLSGPGDRGLHRVAWPLDRDEPRPRELGGPTDPGELRRVRPGTFEVTLEAGEAELTETVVVKEGWVERVPGRVR